MPDIEKISVNGFYGCACSEIGGRSENQDSYGWTKTPWGLAFTVCDGMGGGPAGATASRLAVSTIKECLSANQPFELHQIVLQAIRMANETVYKEAQSDLEFHGMGTTCTVLAISGNNCVIAHVGDSRVYQLRNGRKVFRTWDHSMVFDLVKEKILTEEQARQSPKSNIITRALGLLDEVEIDVKATTFNQGDRFMLTTDGIHGAYPEVELLADVCAKQPLEKIVEAVSLKVNKIGVDKGNHHDNNTIMLIEAVEAGANPTWCDRLLHFFHIK